MKQRHGSQIDQLLWKRGGLVTMVLLLAVPGPASAQANKRDVIWLKDTKTLSGKIQASQSELIKIEVSGKPRSIPVDAISRLRLSDDPTGMSSVRASVQAGNLEQASAQIKSIKPAGRPITRQDLAFHRILIATRLALQGTGEVTDAAREVGGFLRNYPSSFRYYEACELMGDLAMGLGRFESAVNYYAKIGQSASKALSARGNLLQANAWLRQGDFAKASSHFQQAMRTGEARIRNLATVGLAVCEVENGNATQAIRQLETIIKDNASTDFELFARTYNALGLAYQALGQNEAALDAYLHTHLLFYRQLDAHAEALYHLAALWAEVKNPGEANKARQTLKTRFASSTWAKK